VLNGPSVVERSQVVHHFGAARIVEHQQGVAAGIGVLDNACQAHFQHVETALEVPELLGYGHEDASGDSRRTMLAPLVACRILSEPHGVLITQPLPRDAPEVWRTTSGRAPKTRRRYVARERAFGDAVLVTLRALRPAPARA